HAVYCVEGWMAVTFFSASRRRHTRFSRDWSSDVCSSDLSALSTGANQAKMRIACLEESLARQAERHGMQIAEMEAHFVQKLTEVDRKSVVRERGQATARPGSAKRTQRE